MKIGKGVDDVIDDPDVKVTTYISDGQPEKEKELCIKAIKEGTDGIIIFPSNEHSNKDFYSKLIADNFPIVFLDRSPVKNCNIIQSNYYAFVPSFCSSGYDFAIHSSRLHLTVQTFRVALKFVGNYASVDFQHRA